MIGTSFSTENLLIGTLLCLCFSLYCGCFDNLLLYTAGWGHLPTYTAGTRSSLGVIPASRGTTTGALSVVALAVELTGVVDFVLLDRDQTPVVMVIGAGLEQFNPVHPCAQKQVPAFVQTLVILKNKNRLMI